MLAPRILVIDDDPVIRDSVSAVLLGEGYHVTATSDPETGVRLASQQATELLVLDLKMPRIDGMQVLGKVRADDPDLVVIVITAFGTVESAVDAMKAGAHDYLLKPFSPDELRVSVKRGLDVRRLTMQNQLLREVVSQSTDSAHTSGLLMGSSRAMEKVRILIEKVGPTDSTVLLLGETGTGKEVAARMIHGHSLRRSEPMLTVDCGSLAETLFESELFGHVKGSFTGAYQSKPGRFELASGGTLFFDEIGNIGPQIQAKLLRAIQEREITRVGGTAPIKVDIRLIAATNMDLSSAVSRGAFREDLFYRLSVLPIHLPPLRERKEDVPMLAKHFFARHVTRRNKHLVGISDEAMKALLTYDWPGNVRELETLIERAVVLGENSVLRPKDLMFFGRMDPEHARAGRTCAMTLEEVEKDHIARTLESMGWHLSRSAGVLGIDRKTLRRKIAQFGIGRPAVENKSS